MAGSSGQREDRRGLIQLECNMVGGMPPGPPLKKHVQTATGHMLPMFQILDRGCALQSGRLQCNTNSVCLYGWLCWVLNM